MAEPEPDGGDTTLAAVAYILTWLTGLIIYLVADEDDRYARWHALQAIGFGVVIYVLGWILGVIGIAAGLGLGVPGVLGFGALGSIWVLIAYIIVIIMAIKAYQGESVRLPFIADIADDHA